MQNTTEYIGQVGSLTGTGKTLLNPSGRHPVIYVPRQLSPAGCALHALIPVWSLPGDYNFAILRRATGSTLASRHLVLAVESPPHLIIQRSTA